MQDSYYNEIKNQLISCEVVKKVKEYSTNKYTLDTYYRVGELLSNAGKHYGEGILIEYSKKLVIEIGKKYSLTTLKYMRLFYKLINEKGQPVVDELSWSHYIQLLPLKDINEINYYIRICKEQNLSKRYLREKIKSHEYQRLDNKTKLKLIENKEDKRIEDYIKHPIVINTNKEIISEKILHKVIMEDICSFMKELGDGYCLIDSEYKIKVEEDKYNYIDLLLFNIKYNSYVVIELKVTKLRKEHIGQIETYMNYIDTNIKTITQNKTIGIIISKEENRYVIKYCSNPNIFNTTYVKIIKNI